MRRKVIQKNWCEAWKVKYCWISKYWLMRIYVNVYAFALVSLVVSCPSWDEYISPSKKTDRTKPRVWRQLPNLHSNDRDMNSWHFPPPAEDKECHQYFLHQLGINDRYYWNNNGADTHFLAPRCTETKKRMYYHFLRRSSINSPEGRMIWKVPMKWKPLSLQSFRVDKGNTAGASGRWEVTA